MNNNQPHLPEGGIVLSEEWHEYFNALIRDVTAAGSIPKSEARRRILKLVELCTNDISQEAFKKGREAGMREALEVAKSSRKNWEDGFCKACMEKPCDHRTICCPWTYNTTYESDDIISRLESLIQSKSEQEGV